MHEALHHQATGLVGLSRHSGASLVAMVQHGDDSSEMPLLWQLCNAMVGLGYPVTVLDATQSESAHNPGLGELLEYRFGSNQGEYSPRDWSVLPSAQGLQRMRPLGGTHSKHRQHPLERLGELFTHHGVVVLYAGVDMLVDLLGGTAARPLLTVAPRSTSLLTSYIALKRLLRKGGLEPTLLHMMEPTAQAKQAQAPSAAYSLTECARNFLNYDVNPIAMDLSPGPQSELDLRRLAMRLLEHALPLREHTPARTLPTGSAQGPEARSH
jgi:hypothetical protein